MKKPIPNESGLALADALYDFNDVTTTEKLATPPPKRKTRLYASRCADHRTPFIQEREVQNE